MEFQIAWGVFFKKCIYIYIYIQLLQSGLLIFDSKLISVLNAQRNYSLEILRTMPKYVYIDALAVLFFVFSRSYVYLWLFLCGFRFRRSRNVSPSRRSPDFAFLSLYQYFWRHLFPLSSCTLTEAAWSHLALKTPRLSIIDSREQQIISSVAEILFST